MAAGPLIRSSKSKTPVVSERLPPPTAGKCRVGAAHRIVWIQPQKSPPDLVSQTLGKGAFQVTFRQDRDFRSSLDVGRQKLQARNPGDAGASAMVCPTPQSVPCYGSCKTQPGTCRNKGVNRSLFTFQQNKTRLHLELAAFLSLPTPCAPTSDCSTALHCFLL